MTHRSALASALGVVVLALVTIASAAGSRCQEFVARACFLPCFLLLISPGAMQCRAL